MPTQLDYERAADDFRRAAARLDELFTPPRHMMRLGVSIGGRFTDDLRTLFDHVQTLFDRHAGELRDLSATCVERADACAAYRAELRAYHEALDRYQGEIRRWYAQIDAHDRAPEMAASPGARPFPPREPAAPPSWLALEAS
jgi:hypothetical protein